MRGAKDEEMYEPILRILSTLNAPATAHETYDELRNKEDKKISYQRVQRILIKLQIQQWVLGHEAKTGVLYTITETGRQKLRTIKTQREK